MIISVLASKASSRFGIPSLLLFLLIGMGVHTQGITGIPLISYSQAQQVGILALVFILFSGGLNTEFAKIRALVRPALILSTLGVLVATVLVGVFSHQLLGFSFNEGCLLGATIASTDVAAVFTVLRSKNVRLKEGLGPLLELESALNDPMTVFLGMGILGLITRPDQSILHLLPTFFQQMVLGTLLGGAFGLGARAVINRIRLEFDGLYPVLSIGLVLVIYTLTQLAGGSGFLAVYVAGIVLGNQRLLHKKSLTQFHDGIAWLMQISMFLAMGLLVNPRELWRAAPYGLAVSAFLVFVARPLSVFACFLRSRFDAAEKLMISWAGLRGAVPIILATYPFVAGVPQASAIFHLVFFVTFVSVLLQGATIPLVAFWLRVDLPFQEKIRFPLEFNPTPDLLSQLIEVAVPENSPYAGSSLLELALPADLLIVLILRAGKILIPRGSTRLNGKDTLLVLAENPAARTLEAQLRGPSASPTR